MAPTVLKEFTLSVDMETFLDAFWLDTAWYEKFLTEKLEDLRVEVGEWNGSPGPQSMRTRSICSYHPSKISFPGLPSHAEVSTIIELVKFLKRTHVGKYLFCSRLKLKQ